MSNRYADTGTGIGYNGIAFRKAKNDIVFLKIVLYIQFKMLYARINKEYINQDELAKNIVFERTISQVNKLYKDQPEVAMKPGQLSSQLKYGFDSLFEGFRSAIEQVLAADYNGDITTQKTYEIIRNIINFHRILKM